MDSLVDECSAAFRCPTALDGAAVILGGSVPLHVGVSLEDLAEAALTDGFLYELAGIVEPVLADDTKRDTSFARRLNHFARGVEIRGNRLLHLHVLLGLR